MQLSRNFRLLSEDRGESAYPLLQRPEKRHMQSARKLLITAIALIIIAAVGVIAFTIAAAAVPNPYLLFGAVTCALAAIALSAAVCCAHRSGRRLEVRRGFDRLPVENAFVPSRLGYLD